MRVLHFPSRRPSLAFRAWSWYWTLVAAGTIIVWTTLALTVIAYVLGFPI